MSNEITLHELSATSGHSFRSTLDFLDRQDEVLDPSLHHIHFRFVIGNNWTDDGNDSEDDDDVVYTYDPALYQLLEGISRHAKCIREITLSMASEKLSYDAINKLGTAMQEMTNLTSIECLIERPFIKQVTSLKPFFHGFRHKEKLKTLYVNATGRYDNEGKRIGDLLADEVTEITAAIEDSVDLSSVRFFNVYPNVVRALANLPSLTTLSLAGFCEFEQAKAREDYASLARLSSRRNLKTLVLAPSVAWIPTGRMPLPVYTALQNNSKLRLLSLIVDATNEFDCYQTGEVIRLNSTIDKMIIGFHFGQDYIGLIANAVAKNQGVAQLRLVVDNTFNDPVFGPDLQQQWLDALKQNVNITMFDLTRGSGSKLDEQINQLDTVKMMHFYAAMNKAGRKQLVQTGTRRDWVDALHANRNDLLTLFCLLQSNPLICDLETLPRPKKFRRVKYDY